MNKLIYLFCCLFAGACMVAAQTGKVTGTVVSSEDGEPIIGASVKVKGAAVGDITDLNGAFAVTVPANAKTLVISYVGMVSQEVAIKPNLGVIRLVSDTHALDEVVVTALGISREKKSLGYAVQEVKSAELTQAGQMNLSGSLTGKIAGVQVNQFGGTVGASSRISIRGNSSFEKDQQPLIVVDGVPVSNDTERSGNNRYEGVDYGSGLNDINPEDIENITVLKGGSAALYGMRAGRGVILITTKKGRSSKGVTVSYDANLTLSQVANLPRLQNLYGQGHNGDETYWKRNGAGMSYQEYSEKYGFNFNGVNTGYDESWGPRLDIGLMIPQYDSPAKDGVYQPTAWVSQPNNIRDFFQTGSAMNHTISVLSQSEKSSARASLSVRDEIGTVPNTDQKRYSGQFSSTMTLNKYFSLEMMGNYTHTRSENLLGQGYGNNNPINSLTVWSGRQINMQTLKDNWNQKDAAGNYTHYNWIGTYHVNPYFTINKNTNSLDRDRFFSKASVFYQPFEFLKIEGRLGYDYYQVKTFERLLFHWDVPEGSFNQRNTRNAELNMDVIAMFNKSFGNYSVTASAGANYRDATWEQNKIGAGQLTVPGVYTISNAKGAAQIEMDHSQIRSNSIYASASVGWKSQLYVDASARNDWNSTILDPFFYPSISASWIPTETFASLTNGPISFLKLRIGWAEIGAATTAYRNRAYYYAENNAFNGVAQMYRSMTYPNPNLRPENIATWETGLEFGLFNNRLHADVAYYQKKTTDQIITVPTSYTVGFSQMLLNAGQIDTKGLEIQLKGDILKNAKGLNWTSTVNFSKEKSIVVELDPNYPNLKTMELGWTWGIPNQAKVGEEWGVLVTTGYDRITKEDVESGDVVLGNGAKIGDIKVTESGLLKSKSGEIIAHVTPKFLAGWRNDFQYKQFAAGIFLDMRIGGDIWSQSMMHSYTAGLAAITAEDGIRERMILPGRDVVKDERFAMQNEAGEWVPNTIEVTAQEWFEDGGLNPLYVFDGSFLKLREAYISYIVPASALAKTKFISNASISLIGSNLWLMWVHKSNTLRLDPETGGVSSDTRGVGFEQASVPSSRTFGLKLNLTF
ncbi:MAG: SusC/RagA family TonB-linked outer membrane protein [Tannerellaceae bacterium]|jgi:TonB-linked SusC/RagA family outer membrane protein|nr:SusC/RagA family TonB-linked outer membrane protein [Tannerellaceae bacterium]